MKNGNMVSMSDKEQELFHEIGGRIIDNANGEIQKYQDEHPGMIQTAYLGAALSLYLGADFGKKNLMDVVEQLIDSMLT